MTKITIEVSGIKSAVEDKQSEIDLNEMLVLIEQALKGVGFHFDGSLEIVEGIN